MHRYVQRDAVVLCFRILPPPRERARVCIGVMSPDGIVTYEFVGSLMQGSVSPLLKCLHRWDDGAAGEFYSQHELLIIAVTDEEHRSVHQLCETLVAANTEYDLFDAILMRTMPCYSPSDVSLFAAKRFRCTQLVVLVLRECLAASHRVRGALADINSRVIRPPELYELLAPLPCSSVIQMRVTAVRHVPF